MQLRARTWTVSIGNDQEGKWFLDLMEYDDEMRASQGSCASYSSSATLFQELLTVLDASIFTFLAIAEERLPEGQLPLA